MAMSVQAQQPRQHARGPEGPGHDFDLVKRTADRSSSVRLGERGLSRNSGRNCRPIWHVKLKVFDISKGMAELYGGFFVSDKKKGIWHTNVVVFGLEYFYVSTICVCPVGMGWPGEEQLTEVLDMGTTERTAFELEAFLRAQQRLFTPNKYDMFKHNCNHFSDLVLRFLNHRLRVPSYIASLPERVLQTTLGKLVYPLVNAAMDRKKSDICQHADRAELCGEIFFYGGVMPLLMPGERSTQVLMKRVVEEFKQQQLEAVAHRSSTAMHRSKSCCRRGRPADGAAFLCNRSNSQRAAAVAAFYSDAVLPRRRERARCTDGDEGRVWWSKEPHGEPQMQHQQQQRQQEQSHAEHALKGLLHTRRASSGRRTRLRGITAAGGDVVPACFSEAFPTATAEHSSVPGGGVSLEKERRHVLVGGMTLSGGRNEVDDGWGRRPENWLTSSMPLRRERPHVAASQHASGTKDAEGAEVSGGPQEKQRIHRGSRSSGRSEPSSLPCQWKSPADFFHITDDASSRATGAVSAVVAQPTHQRAARCLRGVSGAKGSDSSGCSECCRHGNPLASTASHERVGTRAADHIAGRAAAPTRDVVVASSGVVPPGEKRAACNSVRGSLTLLHKSQRGADAGFYDRRRAARGKGRSPGGVSLKPAAEVSAIRNPPCSSVSSASTTVGSRISAHSSRKATSPSSGSRNKAYSRSSLQWSSFALVPESLKTRAPQRDVPHAENLPADDYLDCLPVQSLRLHCPQTAEDTDTTAEVPTRGNLVPSAAPDAIAVERCSASDFSGDASASATGCWNCEARRDTTGSNQPSSRQGSSDCSRSCDGDAPEDDLRSSRGQPSSLQHRHLDASYEKAAEEPDEAGEAWTWTCRDGGVCRNRRHTVTSEKLAPVEGDVGVEDTARSRQSNDYSTVSETNDNCADCETDWIQQQWWTQQPKEKQLEQEDAAHQLHATEVDVTWNGDKRDLFLFSGEGRRINLSTGNTHSGSSPSILHDSSAAGCGLQWEPHTQGQVEEHSSAISSPVGRSDSCSCIGATDAVGKYGASWREWCSATHDGIVLSVSPPELTRRRSASVDSEGAASEPVWQDAEEQGETQESEEVDDESRSGKLWLPAITTAPPPFREATGNAEDSSNGSETEATPADCSPFLKCSTSTVPPGSNCNSFESASDCCFLESAHEDEEERGEEFQEAKEGRTSSGEEKEDRQRAEGTTKVGCNGNASSSGEVGSVKLCASGFHVPPTVSWQAGGREGNGRFTRLSPGRTCVAEKEAHVASSTAEAGEPEDTAWQSLLLETSRDGEKTGRCRQSGEKRDATHAGARGSGRSLCGVSRGRIAGSSSRLARASRRADTSASSKGSTPHFECSRTALESTPLNNDEDTKATCAFLRGLEEQVNNGESRATSPSVCSDWWQQREERDTNAVHSAGVFPEKRTEVAASCQAPSEQQKQEESIKDDFEEIRASFFPPSSPAFSPR